MDDLVRPETLGQPLEPPLLEPGEPPPLPELILPFASEAAPEPLPVEPGGSGSDLAALVERLEVTTAAGFADLRQEFQDRLALDRFKEEQITKLHDELQAYRNDLVNRTARQILQGVIRLHDSLGKVVTALRQKPTEELTPERFFQQLDGFRDDIELLLDQHEVKPFEVIGEELDPRRQTAVNRIPTEDTALVGRVAERLRPGFEQGETLLQKERVAVYAAANGTHGKI